MNYRVTMKIEVIADYASVEDFQREIDVFNKANEGVIQITEVEFAPIEDENEVS